MLPAAATLQPDPGPAPPGPPPPHRRVSTGVPALDDVLGGLYWGDNVVWQLDGAAAEPFFGAIAAEAGAFHAIRRIAVRGAGPGELLREIRRRCEAEPRTLLLFEPLDAMAAAWGAELTRGFFARCCPMLLEVGAVAYWSMDLRPLPATIRETVEAVAQCVLRLDRHSVRVAKAEGRDQSVRGSLLHWHPGSDGPVLAEAEVTGRVAASLRALRRSRRISQKQLAAMAGVTPSAMSQAERAERGLSLSTLVRLSGTLGLTVDDLLHGEEEATYRIGRRGGEPHGEPDPATTLLAGLASGVRIDLHHLAPRECGAPTAPGAGEGIVAVARGLVQVDVGDQTPAIRDGEVLLADAARVQGWRNLGDRDAVLFWIVVERR